MCRLGPPAVCSRVRPVRLRRSTSRGSAVSRSSSTSRWPARAATCAAVQPSLLASSGRAPGPQQGGHTSRVRTSGGQHQRRPVGPLQSVHIAACTGWVQSVHIVACTGWVQSVHIVACTGWVQSVHIVACTGWVQSVHIVACTG